MTQDNITSPIQSALNWSSNLNENTGKGGMNQGHPCQDYTWMMKSDESSDSEHKTFKIYEEGKLKETLICHKFTLN